MAALTGRACVVRRCVVFSRSDYFASMNRGDVWKWWRGETGANVESYQPAIGYDANAP